MPGHHVGVAVDELGHAVHDDVRAELDGALQERGGEGVVHEQQGAVLVGDLGGGGDIGEHDGGVGRGLDEDDLGVRLHGGAEGVEIGGVDEGRLDAEAAEVALHDHPRRAVDRRGADQVVALVEQREGHRAEGGHPGTGGEALGAALEGGHGLFEAGDGGVAHAGVDVAVGLSGETSGALGAVGEGEGGGLDDRRRHGAGGLVDVLAGVDGLGRASEVLEVVAHEGSLRPCKRVRTTKPSRCRGRCAQVNNLSAFGREGGDQTSLLQEPRFHGRSSSAGWRPAGAPAL